MVHLGASRADFGAADDSQHLPLRDTVPRHDRDLRQNSSRNGRDFDSLSAVVLDTSRDDVQILQRMRRGLFYANVQRRQLSITHDDESIAGRLGGRRLLAGGFFGGGLSRAVQLRPCHGCPTQNHERDRRSQNSHFHGIHSHVSSRRRAIGRDSVGLSFPVVSDVLTQSQRSSSDGTNANAADRKRCSRSTDPGGRSKPLGTPNGERGGGRRVGALSKARLALRDADQSRSGTLGE